LTEKIKEQNINFVMKRLLVLFINRMTEVRFGGYNLTKEELRTMIEQTKDIVRQLTNVSPEEEKRGVIEEKHKFKSKVEELEYKIREAHVFIKKKEIQKAKKLYKHVARHYSKMSADERKKIYKNLHSLFEKIKEEINKIEKKK